MTTVPMADAVGPSSRFIPLAFTKVAGYRTGGPDIIWTSEDVARFAKLASIISIDQTPGLSEFAHGLADVADVEPGAGTIENFVIAAGERQRANKRSGLYCSFVNLPTSVERILEAKLNINLIDFWVADWNLNQAEASAMIGHYQVETPTHGKVTINIVAVQWASPSSNPTTVLPGTNPPVTLKYANVDLSETSPNWFPHVLTPPVGTTKIGVVVTNDLEIFPVVSKDSGKTWEHR